MALIAEKGKRVMELIALHKNATTWHHYCGINSTEPRGEFFQSHVTIGII